MPEVAVEETFVQHGAEGTLAVSLDGGEILNSLQFDVTLPEGVELADDGDGYAVSLNGETAAASHSVSASRLLSGDANDNGAVAIDDVVATVGYILEKNPEPFVVERADVDRNGTINVGDVSGIVKIILINTSATDAVATKRLRANHADGGQIVLGNLTVGADCTASVTLSIESPVDFTALQTDVTIPESLTVESVTLDESQASTHSIAHAMVSGSIMRVVAYSTGLSNFNAEAPLLRINLRANNYFHGGEISVGATLASDSNASVCSLGGADGYVDNTFTGLTDASSAETDITTGNGVITITGPADLSCEIVNAQGITVASFTTTSNDTVTLSNGIYIVRISADMARKVII